MSSVFEELIGNPIGEAAAFAAGLAIHPLLKPLLQEEQNLTWSLYRSLPLDPQVAAQLVARNIVTDAGTGAAEAALSGISTSRFDYLAQLEVQFPGLSELLELDRRAVLPAGDLVAALQRQGFTAEYAGFLAQLVDGRLSPQQVALGIVRGLVADPGLMPVDLDTSGGKVPAYQVAALSALTEAADGGIDEERLRVMVGSIGLPMSTQQAASAFFRGIIAQGDFNRSILEGDVRPEWAPFILDQARQILSAEQYTELQIRGFYDEATRRENTALHGMSDADSDNLYNVLGRAPAIHQVVIGLARGGKYPGSYANVPEPYKSAIQRSNIREEWSEVVYAGRYGYPTGFMIKAEAVAGTTNQADTEAILLELGWDPKWATKYSTAWAGGTTTAGTAVKKETLSLLTQEYLSGVLTPAAFTTAVAGLGYSAQQATDLMANANFKAASAERTRNTRLIEKQYVAVKINEAQARTDLAQLGWPQGVIDNKINAWNIERAIAVTTLTVAQIAAALKAGALLASQATPLLQDLGEDANAIATIIATAGANPAT